jgi:hypothetical protein
MLAGRQRRDDTTGIPLGEIELAVLGVRSDLIRSSVRYASSRRPASV